MSRALRCDVLEPPWARQRVRCSSATARWRDAPVPSGPTPNTAHREESTVRSSPNIHGTSALDYVLQDRAVNPEGKSRTILAWFRLAQLCRGGRSPLPRLLERVVDRSYRSVTAWWFAMELHPDVTAGPRLRLFHANGIVINPSVTIGSDCVLRASTCLGVVSDASGRDGRGPRLGDRVDVGVGVNIIGDLSVGTGARVGAGAVVVRDVEPGTTVAGNPARPLHATGS